MKATEAEVDTKLDANALEHACREIALDHYAKRFATVRENPIVTMNADSNWHIFEADAKRAITAYLSTLQVQTSEAVAWRTDIFESLPNGKLTRLILDASEVKNPDPDWTPLYTRSPQ